MIIMDIPKQMITIGFLMFALTSSLFSAASLHQRNLHLLDFIQADDLAIGRAAC